MAKILTDDNFVEETQKGITLVDFYAEWCGPCKATAPVIDMVAQELTDAKMVKVNVDESPETAMKFGIRSIPTIVAIRDGEEVERHVGASVDKKFYFEMAEKAKL